MYCIHCGNEIAEDAVVCVHCGRLVEEQKPTRLSERKKGSGCGLAIAAGVLMAVGCIVNSVHSATSAAGVLVAIAPSVSVIVALLCALIPLAWGVPMTIVFFMKIKSKEKVGTAFKVCTLLFVSTISGIIMLCDDNV